MTAFSLSQHTRRTTTLNCEEIVTDQMLRDLARSTPLREQGELTPIEVAQLVMVLPDICGELLARRAAARKDIAA